MPATYKILAVPLNQHGVYWVQESNAIIEKSYQTKKARNDFWNKYIAPCTTAMPPANKRQRRKYEYVIHDYLSSGQPTIAAACRYADDQLITGRVELIYATHRIDKVIRNHRRPRSVHASTGDLAAA